MYIPAHFREDDLTTLQAFIREYPFATVATQLNDKLIASHIPLTFDARQGPYGALFGHVARGNQQGLTFDGSQEVLVIFQGPHAYISASWYENPSKSVPTWNYATVHAYGVAQHVNNEELLHHLTSLVQRFEADSEAPWPFEPRDEFIQRMALGIIGFTIPITRIEGKFKLSQNRSQHDQERVIEALLSLPGSDAKDVASLMQARLAGG